MSRLAHPHKLILHDHSNLNKYSLGILFNLEKNSELNFKKYVKQVSTFINA
jgi:hypothetical protein